MAASRSISSSNNIVRRTRDAIEERQSESRAESNRNGPHSSRLGSQVSKEMSEDEIAQHRRNQLDQLRHKEQSACEKQESRLYSVESNATFVRTVAPAPPSIQQKHQAEATCSHLSRASCLRENEQMSSREIHPAADSACPMQQATATQSSDFSLRLAERGPHGHQPMASLDANQHHQHHHHHHRAHAASCIATKMIGAESQPLSPRFKQHQPHCVHHNLNYQRHIQPLSSSKPAKSGDASCLLPMEGTQLVANKVAKHFKQADNNKSYLLVKYRPSAAAGEQQHCAAAVGFSGRARQLEAEARANGRYHHQHEPAIGMQMAAASATNNKRTTIKFISQLYFLLHLSAILSLLLHHKNLVTSERKASAAAAAHHHYHHHHHHHHQAPDEAHTFGANHVRRATGSNESLPTVNGNQQHERHHHHQHTYAPDPGHTIPNPLPVPLMLQSASAAHNNGSGQQQQLISSVVVATAHSGPSRAGSESGARPASNSGSGLRATRFGRHVTGPAAGEPQSLAASPDILVRLVGYRHARCALQYFLCYLLSSSVVILIWLRLFRLCASRGVFQCGANEYANSGNNIHSSAKSRNVEPQAPQADTASLHGFYYRTRLDCTPVLIGSISLGLIQLIVIGLDVANNINWLTSDNNHWPLYLPVLQFVFVSLLMQFILGRVAKNQEKKKSGSGDRLAAARPQWRQQRDGIERQELSALSINDGRGNANNGAARGNNNFQPLDQWPAASGSLSSSFSLSFPSSHQEQHQHSPISSGLQNIALAHLLVTHILLWLMKLNSMSLFQAIEQQQQQSVASVVVAAPPAFIGSGRFQQQQANHSSTPSHSPVDSQSTGVLGGGRSPPSVAVVEVEVESHLPSGERNRSELESMLRRKWSTRSAATAEPSSVRPLVEVGPKLAPPDSKLTPGAAGGRSGSTEPQTNSTIAGSHITSTSTTTLAPVAGISRATESGTLLVAVRPQANVSSLAETPTGHQTKSERGLRSAAQLAPASGPDAELVGRLAQDASAAGLPALNPNSNGSVTISQAQLLSLISLAAKNELVLEQQRANLSSGNMFKSSLPKRMTAFRQAKPNLVSSLPPGLLSGLSGNASNSNATTTRAQQATAPLQLPAPGVLGPSNSNSTNSKLPAEKSQKQRARILVSHPGDSETMSNEPQATTGGPTGDALGEGEKGGRGKVSPEAADEEDESEQFHANQPAGDERPFPSVESDPPLGGSSSVLEPQTASPASSQVEAPGRTRTEELSIEKPIRVAKAKKLEGSKMGQEDKEPVPTSTSTTSSPDEDSSDADQSDEADVDLDSLLPPVPNYNETGSLEELPSARKAALKGSRSLAGKKKEPKGDRRRVAAGGSRKVPTTMEPSSGSLSEDAFVFNEAASNLSLIVEKPMSRALAELASQALIVSAGPNSTNIGLSLVSNATTNVTIATTLNGSLNAGQPSLAPAHAALVMQPFMLYQQQSGGQNSGQWRSGGSLGQEAKANQQQSSFADYLLPIVHQYHILIIAILFNMWLDSLCKKRPAPAASGLADRKKTRALVAPPGGQQRRLLVAGQRQANHHRRRERPPAGSSSELGSLSCGSSTKGLIAIPIRNDSRLLRRLEASTEPKSLAAAGPSQLASLGLVTRAGAAKGQQHSSRHGPATQRSRSMDLLHRQRHQHSRLANGNLEENHSNASTLSRYSSLRSSSSERLLWIPSGQLLAAEQAKSPLAGARKPSAADYSLAGSSTGSSVARSSDSMAPSVFNGERARRHQACSRQRHELGGHNGQLRGQYNKQTAPINSVCSVFFGLLIVSGSLIVILLDLELLSMLTQCLTKLISILVSLVGLVLIRRARRLRSQKAAAAAASHQPNWAHSIGQLGARTSREAKSGDKQLAATSSGGGQAHRQCFHYLFLLAAYYCGLSIALNLGKQHSMQELFSQQVIQFIQRLFLQTSNANPERLAPDTPLPASGPTPLSLANYLFLFHLALALKGLLLIVQVTLQTVLIRASCEQATRELRQIYTFLMFANLSLWAMEICEQQRRLHQTTSGSSSGGAMPSDEWQHHLQATLAPGAMDDDGSASKLVTLDSFSRFAASIVTLSHLYHGLVFMQH